MKDLHLRFGFKKPTGRSEGFESQITDKLNFVRDFIKSNDIKHLVLTGDTFDKKTPSHYGLDQVRLNLDAIKILSDVCNVYDIAGNHSLPYSSREYKKSSLHSLAVNNGLVKDLHNNFYDLEFGLTLTGVDYTWSDEQFREDMKKAVENANIIVIHEHLFPDSVEIPPFVKGYYYREFVEKFSIPEGYTIIAGHLHKGFPTEVVNGVVFVNPWNLTRLARSYYSLSGEHTPEMVVLNYDCGEVKYKHIEIPHENFQNAFVLDELKKAESESMEISEFLSMLGDNPEDIANLDWKNADFPENVRSRIEYYISQAENQC